jgi:hypothetical protein
MVSRGAVVGVIGLLLIIGVLVPQTVSITGTATVFDYDKGTQTLKVTYTFSSISDEFTMRIPIGTKLDVSADEQLETTLDVVTTIDQTKYFSTVKLDPIDLPFLIDGNNVLDVKELRSWNSFLEYEYQIIGAERLIGSSTIGLNKDLVINNAYGNEDILIENLGFLSNGIDTPDTGYYVTPSKTGGYHIYDTDEFIRVHNLWSNWRFYCGKGFHTYDVDHLMYGAEGSILSIAFCKESNYADSNGDWRGINNIIDDFAVRWGSTDFEGYTDVDVSPTEITLTHPLRSVAGAVTIWYPDSFVGAIIQEKPLDVRTKIISINPSSFDLKEDELGRFQVSVKNIGTDDGPIRVVGEGEGFSISCDDEKRVASGQTLTWNCVVGLLGIDAGTQIQVNSVITALGVLGDDSESLSLKGTRSSLADDNDGDGIPNNVDKCPDTKGVRTNEGCPSDPAIFETGIWVTDNQILFKGDNVYYGSIWAIGFKTANVETTSLIDQAIGVLSGRGVEFVTSTIIPFKKNVRIVTASGEDIVYYSILLKADIDFGLPSAIYVGGVQQGVSEQDGFHFTSPLFYILYGGVILLIGVIGYLFIKR